MGVAAEDQRWMTRALELAREARQIARHNRLHPLDAPRLSHVERCLAGGAPVVATTDYSCALPQLIGSYIEPRLVALGTDGFGRSDTRKALRRFFEVDRYQIVLTALYALSRDGVVDKSVCAEAIMKYDIDASAAPPWLS